MKKLINNKNRGGGNTCSKILTPIQVGPTCWFMATFVAMFYSQRNRKILLKASGDWGNESNDRLFRFLRYILNNRYLKTGEDIENYKKYSDNYFIDILELLHKNNKETFPYNPKNILDGFFPDIYLARLYKLLNVDYKIFDHINYNNKILPKYNILSYSYYNKEYDNILELEINDKKKLVINTKKSIENIDKYILKEDKNKFKYVDDDIAPSILIIRHFQFEELFDYDLSESWEPFLSKKIVYTEHEGELPLLYNEDTIEVKKKNIYDELTSMKDDITYNENEYSLDSVILSNYNYSSNNHAICGITCKDKKYIYNGWAGISNDPSITQNITRNIPCGLMKYNWDIKKSEDFTIVSNICEPIILKNNHKNFQLHFNFNKGERTLIYVRKNAISENSKEISPPPPPPYPPPFEPLLPKGWERVYTDDGEVYYVNHSEKIARWDLPSEGGTIKKSIGKKSICNTKSPKKCPEGKVLNPKTGRYILIKNALNKNGVKSKSPKKCPKGTVLNPKTGRYILIKNI